LCFAVVSEGSETMSLTLYCNPKCPFARRAMVALAEKSKSYETVLIPLSGQLNKIKGDASLLEEVAGEQWPGKSVEELVQLKEDYKRDINSTGEVPTLVVDGKIIAEADVVAEYVEDAFPEDGVKLMPSDAYKRSTIRNFLKVLGGPGGVSGFYGLLRNQDPAKDEEIRTKVYNMWQSFSKLSGDDGPFFLGADFSLADVLLIPFYDQFRFLWPHFRGTELIPAESEAFPWAGRVQAWARAVEERESFKQFSQTQKVYVDGYVPYAGERGVSEFGK